MHDVTFFQFKSSDAFHFVRKKSTRVKQLF
jgi:hypothetical protein